MNSQEISTGHKFNYKKNLLLKSLNSILLLVILSISLIFFSIRSSDFLTLNNIVTIIVLTVAIGVVCIGQTLLLISGSFDISVGSVAGFSGIVLAKILNIFEINDAGRSLLILLLVIAVGGIIGFINGVIVTKVGINALITTIAMLSIVMGLSLSITKGNYITITTPFFIILGTYNIGNVIPISLIILIILYVAFYVILKTTVFGRYIYAIGNNETASTYAGINVNKIKIILFVIAGATSAIGGIILASKLTNAQAIFGQNYPITTIAACVLGGSAISGGKGGVLGSLIGISFLSVLINGLSIIGLPTNIQNLVTGIILIIALYISEFWLKKK
ncbi:MAG: ABC transporter permease [Actinobacteria bacterium]|nr:ABC transporter permease [Actinomycetota bacterium]